MTTLIHTAFNQASHFTRRSPLARTHRSAALNEAEFQTVYALVVALLAGGVLVTLTGLAHAFG